MKRVMVTAGIVAVLLGSAGESRAETTYVDKIQILTHTRRDVEVTVYSNNLSCDAKTLSSTQLTTISKETGFSYWRVPISHFCSSAKVRRLENNDIWFRIKIKDKSGETQSDNTCRNKGIKFGTGSRGTVPVWLQDDGKKLRAQCNGLSGVEG